MPRAELGAFHARHLHPVTSPRVRCAANSTPLPGSHCLAHRTCSPTHHRSFRQKTPTHQCGGLRPHRVLTTQGRCHTGPFSTAAVPHRVLDPPGPAPLPRAPHLQFDTTSVALLVNLPTPRAGNMTTQGLDHTGPTPPRAFYDGRSTPPGARPSPFDGRSTPTGARPSHNSIESGSLTPTQGSSGAETGFSNYRTPRRWP